MLVSRECVVCGDPPPCNCGPDQICFQNSLTCTSCVTITCKDKDSVASSTVGVSRGALTGAIVGILIFLAAVLAAYWYFQKRRRARKAQATAFEHKQPIDLPASAATVLSRPDPVEKPSSSSQGHVRVFSGHSNTTINLHPTSSRTGDSQGYESSLSQSGGEPAIHNPFADQSSIQTTSDQSQANMIPIALLPYGSVQSPTSDGHENRRNTMSPLPSRPLRSPDLNLRMENARPSAAPSSFDLTHVNISNDSVPDPRMNVASSVRSDMSGLTVDSRASYLSTGTYATDLFTESPTIVTRQQGRILGLSKAQVVEVPSSLSNGGSPLASSHLTPTTSRLSRMTTARSIRSPLAQSSFTRGDIIEMDEQPEASPFADVNARGKSSAGPQVVTDSRSVRTNGTFGSQIGQWTGDVDDTDSIASGVEASITSAKRVVVGSGGRGLSQASNDDLLAPSTRSARYSFVSEASSRADSILEAFPFVPPSPLSQKSFGTIHDPPPPSSVVAEPPTTRSTMLDAPDRRTLGLSTFSQASNASSGLEAFPFELQLDSTSSSQPLNKQAARASLDTLALSRDLSAFPLAYDDESESRTRSKYVAPSRKSSTTHVHT